MAVTNALLLIVLDNLLPRYTLICCSSKASREEKHLISRISIFYSFLALFRPGKILPSATTDVNKYIFFNIKANASKFNVFFCKLFGNH